jgi:adenylate kinase
MSTKEITIEERTAPETIIILGAPGSGKDTQAHFLVDALGYQVVSTGELMRILAGHDEGVHEMLQKGELIPDTVVEDELISAFVLLPDGQPVILDGYPRNLDQARKLDEILAQNSRKIDKVIFIELTEAEAIKRIGIRRVCATCGQFTSNKEKVCPECGGKLVEREDDKPESVKRRFKIFHEKTEPIIDFYKERGVLVTVNGMPSPEEVREEVRKAL